MAEALVLPGAEAAGASGRGHGAPCGGALKTRTVCLAWEAELSSACLALAQLSFPQLLDAGKLFSRARLQGARSAADVLEAAAILWLTDRRPQDLTATRLKPLVDVVDEVFRRLPEDEKATVLPRLFPFLGEVASQEAGISCKGWCSGFNAVERVEAVDLSGVLVNDSHKPSRFPPQAVLGWRETVTRTTSMAAAAKAEASAFQELVLQDWVSY